VSGVAWVNTRSKIARGVALRSQVQLARSRRVYSRSQNNLQHLGCDHLEFGGDHRPRIIVRSRFGRGEHAVVNCVSQSRSAYRIMHPLDIHWFYAFGSVALVAGASLTGMLGLALSPKRLSRVVPLMVSMAAGALLGTAFGHLLPEAIERLGSGLKLSTLLLASFVIFFVLEKTLGVWLEGGPNGYGEPHNHFHTGQFTQPPQNSPAGGRSMITNLLFGATVHSFIDGMALATGYCAGTHLGIVTTVAVLLHETPHHIGDVSILIHSGVPVRRAVSLSLAAGSAAAIGALLVLLVGTRSAGMTDLLLPFTTANFLYIASASLLPELQRVRGFRQSLAQTTFLLVGSLLMLAVSFFVSESR
jgi:zinc and cadmium transporter